ncbi:hypothetical protein TWF281_011904 [Arthrobotrys megalospora]
MADASKHLPYPLSDSVRALALALASTREQNRSPAGPLARWELQRPSHLASLQRPNDDLGHTPAPQSQALNRNSAMGT